MHFLSLPIDHAQPIMFFCEVLVKYKLIIEYYLINKIYLVIKNRF